MVDLNELEQLFTILNTIGTIILIVLFWKTIKHLEEASRNAKIQTNYRFRPWIGPTNSIKQMSSDANRHQYVIEIKNYGEIPASNVITMFKLSPDLISREITKEPKNLEQFNLGPLLPNMEKRYWFFINNELIEKAKSGTSEIFILLYFVYEHFGGKSFYGMISQYNPQSDSFFHKDMWVDT